jgi:ribokinase
MSQAVMERLVAHGIAHRPVKLPGHSADWTLLITSGKFGDKLPIAFRGCHAALGWDDLRGQVGEHSPLRVVASLPNALSARLLEAPGAAIRLFAPAIRNATDREHPIGRFAAAVDILACNRAEWESIEDREQVAWTVSILIVTDGRDGSSVRYTRLCGDPGALRVPAFPRARPPFDTNRAGEAYASAFVATLLGAGWTGRLGAIEDDLVRTAALRASAAAALVLDIEGFGFASDAQIDEAIRLGVVA